MSLEFLLSRRSVVAKLLEEPGPDKAQIAELIRAAIRVPDHKALAPWRFLVFTGQARADLGNRIAPVYERNEGADCKERCIENERNRFLRAPAVIGVVSSPVESATVPDTEQLLSAGAACQNILHGAKSLGFAAQWVTEWVAYDKQVHQLLGLDAHESMAGFIYIGSQSQTPKERRRVTPEEKMTWWQA